MLFTLLILTVTEFISRPVLFISSSFYVKMSFFQSMYLFHNVKPITYRALFVLRLFDFYEMK